jgi:endonuclease/exonuclease/phosphatase family metal-dependent hydrolase
MSTGPAGTRRRLVAACYWLLVAPGVVWALMRLVGLERGGPAIQVVAFTPYAALASLVPLALALLARRWWVTAVAAVASAALFACVVPRMVGGPTGPAGVELRVMSTNMRVGGADAATIVDLVRRHRVDVLAVQEITPDAEGRLDAAGLSTLLPYSERSALEGVVGSALYSRYRLTDATTRRNPGEFRQVEATVHGSGARPVALESVHPVPPARGDRIADWSAGLRGQTPATPDGIARVLAGDFNATLDHAELRRLIGTGYHDAASVVGLGLTPTWPYGGGLEGIAPPVAIDHILVDRRIGVRDFDAYTVANTDHRAIIATLVLPPGGP